MALYPSAPAPSSRRPAILRGKPLIALYTLAGVFLFVAFLAANFPYGDTISALLAPFQLKLNYQSQRMRPPIGAELQNVTLISTAADPAQTLLQSPDVTLAPTIGSLFFGHPGLRVRAALFDGIVRATVHQQASVIDLDFNVNAIDLAKIDPRWIAGALISGLMSGAGAAELHGPELPLNQGDLTVTGENVAFVAVKGFPQFHLGAVTGTATLANGTLTIATLKANGGDADIEAEGTIQLADDLPDSAIDMTFTLTPSASGREHFGVFLNLLPHPPEQGPYSVHGPLRFPALS